MSRFNKLFKQILKEEDTTAREPRPYEPMNKTKLTDAQKQQIDDLIANTILPALWEDVCIADMSDVSKNNSDWEDICEDRMNVLYVEALNYLKNNLH